MSNIIFESDFPSGTAIPSATSGQGLGNDTWEFQKKIQFDSNVTIMTGQTLTLTGVSVVGLSSGVDTITATNANAFAVGQNGATNPAFNVDTSTATSATGFNVKSAAAAAGVALSVISSGTNESVTFNAKGSGSITLGNVSTGGINLNDPTVVTSNTANALAAGPNGATNPGLNLDASTASSVTGMNIKTAASGNGLLVSVISSNANENADYEAKGGGSFYINAIATGPVNVGNSSNKPGMAVNGPVNGTTAGANALTTGPSGVTNPSFNVDASTASAVTGINIKAAVTGGTTAVSVTDSGSNSSLSVAAKGTGTITFQPAVAVAAGGNVQSSILMSSTASLGVYFGSGAPTVSAAQGSLYIRTDGSSTSTRMYINTNGSTTWTNVTTAA